MVFLDYWYAFLFIFLFITGCLWLIKDVKPAVPTLKKVTLNEMKTMDDYEFEALVADYFKNEGYKVHHMKKGADAGKDIILWDKDGDKFYVEVKQWTKSDVGRPVIQKLQGAMAGDGVKYGFVVTTAKFSRYAIDWVKNNNITLIDGREFEHLINKSSQ